MRKSIPVWGAAAGVVIVAAILFGRRGLANAPGTFGLGRSPSPPIALLVTADGGVDGGGSISVNSYAALTQTTPDGGNTLVVDNPTNFTPGTVAMVWQTTGLTSPGLDAGWQAPDGGPLNFDITSSPVGNYEWVLISSVLGNTLTLSQPISSAYGYAGGFSQVITVPAFTTVTVNPGASIVPGMPWNGSKGGVVVFTAESVVNNGQILADGYGFRGGILRNQGAGLQNVSQGAFPDQYGCNSLLGWTLIGGTVGGGAHKGEGLVPYSWINELADGGTTFTNEAGSPSDPTFFTYGYGNIANGGGGGNCDNAGGGGGGHGSQGGMGGATYSGDTGGSRPVGGIGGSAFTYNTTDHLAFGGGGGAGDENNFNGTAGGNGGGVVFIQAGSISGTGYFTANGLAPPIGIAPYSKFTKNNDATDDGAGGGGAGGVVVLRASSTACGLASANGGAGGNTRCFGSNGGQGGGGGQGRLDIQPLVPGGCPTQLIPGAPGNATGFVPLTGIATSSPDAGTPAGNLVLSSAPGGFNASRCTPATIATGACGGCLQNSDCSGTSTPVCMLTSSTCVQCLQNSDCRQDGGVYVCDVLNYTCVHPSNLSDAGSILVTDSGVPLNDGGTGGGGGGTDSGTTGDGGTTPSSPTGAGCSCRVGDSASNSAASALVVALASLAAFLRIRRPRRQDS